MNKSIYTSAYYSLIVQFIIAIVCLFGTFIKLDNQDTILHEVLVLETIVQFVEFSFYIWLVYNFSNIRTDISVVRYYDWFFTTPTMLFSLVCFMIYFDRKSNNLSTRDLSLESIYKDHGSIINKILASNK
jgi:bacteriorhodopsin